MAEIVNFMQVLVTLPDGTALGAGANEVSDETLKAFETSEYLQACLAKGLFQIRRSVPAEGSVAPPEQGLPESLSGLSFDTVQKLVEKCDNSAQLERWLATDGRRKVRKLIEERHWALVPVETVEPGKDDQGVV